MTSVLTQTYHGNKKKLNASTTWEETWLIKNWRIFELNTYREFRFFNFNSSSLVEKIYILDVVRKSHSIT